PYKIYLNAKKIKLPAPDFKGKIFEDTVGEVLANGDFSAESISISELSQILAAANGIVDTENKFDLRTTPVPLPQTQSFIYQHPVEIYVLVNRVSGLDAGLYHYSVRDHSLEVVKEYADSMPNCCFTPSVIKDAAVTFILSGIPSRLTWVYDTRSYRYMYMVAGAISQNIFLECSSMGLASIATASFHDDLYNDLLGIDENYEVALLLHLVGKIKP
ncbi:MAG TPA: SagB/ThcOx family dehydrogenase, partial [Candidatus Omnitrophica bacterium]|nr:SagB/ThcOx family dehydrogenase [Candidatus Omnitrophota bacterium]